MFAVSSSIIAPAALSPFLRERYSLAELPECSLLRAGINHSYLVAAGNQRFVFRVYSLNWRSETEIREELRLLENLRRHGLPVSYGIRDRSGGLLQELEAPEGMRYGVLFSYAPGEKIIKPDISVYRQTGALMGRMHRLAADMELRRPTYTWDSLVTKALVRLGAVLPADCPEFLELNALLERLRPALEAHIVGLPQGTVHLDIWFDNLNVTPDGAVTLFDFDFCGTGPVALDPAYSLLQLYALQPEAFAANSTAFLDGYRSQCSISEAETGALPALGIVLYCFYLGVQCERFENYSSVFLSATYLRRYIQIRILRYAGFHAL